MAKYECQPCGFIYDEELGYPEVGIEPGTKWEELPEDWECPICGVGKEEFELVPDIEEKQDLIPPAVEEFLNSDDKEEIEDCGCSVDPMFFKEK